MSDFISEIHGDRGDTPDEGPLIFPGPFSPPPPVPLNTRLTIDSLTNGRPDGTLDGASVVAVVNATPDGQIMFWASRIPDTSRSHVAPFVQTSPNSYTLIMAHPGLWYVWATDLDGVSAEEAAVVVNQSNDTPLNEIGEMLGTILWQNRRGIEAYLHQQYPSETLKQVISNGMETDVTDWPSIVVERPVMRQSYQFFPYGLIIEFSVTIRCIVVFQEEQEQGRLASRFADAVTTVLNEPAYNVMVLPSGLPIALALATTTDVQQSMAGGNKMADVGIVSWSASASTEDNGF
jgi:hypothetical protein